MPTTVNGIGTHYYGKQNVETRQASCQHCGNFGELRSYDTKLWFVVIFVPVIPLGRKRILDECPSCTRHGSIGAGEWEELRSQAIREAKAEYESDPDSAEKAVGLHATLASGGERGAADRLAGILGEKFADNVDVQLYLGSCAEESGDDARANTCFHRAYEIDKSHAGAQQASAVALLREGNAQAAKARVEEAESAGQPIDPGVAFAVAGALHEQNDSAGASELLKKVNDAAPEVQKEKAFRKLAKDVEKRTGEQGAIAAPRSVFQSPGFWWAAAACAVVAGLIGRDIYLTNNQALYVVNGLPTPITVSIDGDTPLQIAPGSWYRNPVASGAHTASVASPQELAGEVSFDVQSGRFSRWFGQPVHVLDPTRSAVVEFEETIFSDVPVNDDVAYEIVVGEAFHTFDDADYLFEPFPNELEVSDTTKQVRKTRVGMPGIDPLGVALVAADRLEDPAILDFIEPHLLFTDDSERLLSIYVGSGRKVGAMDRCLGFLEAHLEKEPIDVQWHRFYQNLVTSQGAPPPVKLYDDLLAKKPNDATRLYLRGRLESFTSKSEPFFRRALDAEPDNALVLSATAYSRMAAGDFEASLEAANKALALDAENSRAQEMREALLIAMGRQAELERELEAKIAEPPFNYGAVEMMVTSLTSNGRGERAKATHRDFAVAVQQAWPDDPHQLVRRVAVQMHRKLGEIEAAEREAQGFSDIERRLTNLALCALLRSSASDAETLIEQLPEDSRSGMWMLTSLTSVASGDAFSSKKHRDRAIAAYRAGGGDDLVYAELLAGDGDPSELVEKALDLDTEAPDKAAVLALVAASLENEADAAKLLGVAEQLNKIPSGYQPIIRTAIEALRR